MSRAYFGKSGFLWKFSQTPGKLNAYRLPIHVGGALHDRKNKIAGGGRFCSYAFSFPTAGVGCCLTLHFAAALQGADQRHRVHVFQIAAGGQPTGQPGDLNPLRFKLLV
jgi:hypothetical protein